MYQAKTERPATAAELAALKAELSPDPASKRPTNPLYLGYTDAQCAAALNQAGRPIPNPVPQGAVAPTVVPKNAVLAVLYTLESAVSAVVNLGQPVPAGATFTAAQAGGVLSFLQGVVANVVNYSEPLDMPYMTSHFLPVLEGLGLITQAQFNASFDVPDPSYVPTIIAGPRLFAILGREDVACEAADVTAALAS